MEAKWPTDAAEASRLVEIGGKYNWGKDGTMTLYPLERYPDGVDRPTVEEQREVEQYARVLSYCFRPGSKVRWAVCDKCDAGEFIRSGSTKPKCSLTRGCDGVMTAIGKMKPIPLSQL